MLAVGAVVLALWFFTERDDATTSTPGTASAPGQPLRAGDPSTREFADDLRRGNVVLLAVPKQAAAAQTLAEDIAGPPERSVREAGQAVLVRRRPMDVRGVTIVAYAQGRTLSARDATDPALRAFAEYWLGRAAG